MTEIADGPMKIGLLVYPVNERETNAKRPYHAIRAVAQQAEADGFDSIWLADHLLYRKPGEPTWKGSTTRRGTARISRAARARQDRRC
jgi:alkanesulfonate monooxygenase SsuD/methylene tetrahydromethanopterin reductase-like flavin-dependent oxidoreductase (luciferase family)